MTGIKKMNMSVEMADGGVHELTVGNPSMVAYDQTRAKRQWPTSREAPFLWSTFLAWHHMRYVLKSYSGSAEDFMNRDCVALEMEDDEDAPEADPTSPVDALD